MNDRSGLSIFDDDSNNGADDATQVFSAVEETGPTAAGSRRNSSYMACAKPALAVSKTLGSTKFTVW